MAGMSEVVKPENSGSSKGPSRSPWWSVMSDSDKIFLALHAVILMRLRKPNVIPRDV